MGTSEGIAGRRWLGECGGFVTGCGRLDRIAQGADPVPTHNDRESVIIKQSLNESNI
jgi:hypothetical protein